MSNDLSNFEISDDEIIEYKLILIGDSSVGKTCLFKKITSGIFLGRNVSTVGIDRKTLSFVYDFDENGKKVSKNVVINLTDTAGQERYKSITQSYYKGSNGVILLYDITDRKSFEHLNEWISNVRNSVGNYEESNYTIFLLGTKIDLVVDDEKRRQVTVEEAKEKCQEFDLEWGGECSSKDFSEDDYKKIFKEFVKKIYDKIGYNVVMRQTISTLTPGKNKKRNCGC
jgi:small GTP-binding protein